MDREAEAMETYGATGAGFAKHARRLPCQVRPAGLVRNNHPKWSGRGSRQAPKLGISLYWDARISDPVVTMTRRSDTGHYTGVGDL